MVRILIENNSVIAWFHQNNSFKAAFTATYKHLLPQMAVLLPHFAFLSFLTLKLQTVYSNFQKTEATFISPTFVYPFYGSETDFL